eukprot:scaffold481_cov208-Cylindrotheca_fusiformis.AAC.10
MTIQLIAISSIGATASSNHIIGTRLCPPGGIRLVPYSSTPHADKFFPFYRETMPVKERLLFALYSVAAVVVALLFAEPVASALPSRSPSLGGDPFSRHLKPYLWFINRTTTKSPKAWSEVSQGEWYVVPKVLERFHDCPFQPNPGS